MTIKEFYSIGILNFISNIRTLFKYNIEKDEIKQTPVQTSISKLTLELEQVQKQIVELYFSLNKEEANQYSDELEHLKNSVTIPAFPYPQLKNIQKPVCGYEKKLNLPFVLHNEKKLYFPEDWTVESASKTYCYYIERENLLGGGFTPKAPHQYITKDFHVEKGDIVLDIGCAEALFALDSIDNAKHIFLIESDEKWIKPLKATFAPYENKVTIIQKNIGNKDSENSITLNSLTKKYTNESFFVKMDIEGAEEEVLNSSKDFLTSNNHIKLACCTYHRSNHAQSISASLKNLNYDIEFSDGYMLFLLDSNQEPPYFRKGLIRARKLFK